MSDEMVFEAFNEKRYAPSLQDFSNSLYDAELEKEMRVIPDRLAFKIGDVADMVGVKPYVLRYWETEFDVLHPQKSNTNQRVYTRKDVELVFMIKKLLYRDRFSIAGARVALSKLRRDSKAARAVGGALNQMEEMRTQIEDLVFHVSAFRQRILDNSIASSGKVLEFSSNTDIGP